MNMKRLALGFAVVMMGCAKKPAEKAAANAGSSAPASAGSGSAAGSSTGSMAASQHNAVAPGMGSAAQSQLSPAARAIDDFDRAFAPIVKLDGGARVRALCTHIKTLEDRSTALVRVSPAGVSDWDDAARSLAGLVGDIGHGCKQIPQKAYASDQALEDGDVASVGDMAGSLHDAFKQLAALVPDAKPIDTHAGDALLPADAPAAPVDVSKVRAALSALDVQVVKLAAAAKHAKTRAEACNGLHALGGLLEGLSAPGVADGPPNAEDWSGSVSNLAMSIGNLDMSCGTDSTSKPAEIADHLEALHESVGRMLEMCK